MGKSEEIISVINYWWSQDYLLDFAKQSGFQLTETLEARIADEQLLEYPDTLRPIQQQIPFYLVMAFKKGK